MAKFLIHNVTHGPFDDGEDFWNVVMAETEDGKIIDMELFFDDMESAMQMKAHFGRSIQPLELEFDDEEEEE